MTNPAITPLLSVLAGAVGKDGKVPAISAREWPALLDLAERHRVTALLAARCAGESLPDPRIAPQLAQRRLLNQAWQRRNALATVEIARALRSAGLWFIVLKGPSVALRFYDEPADRNAIDIDVLVEERALGEAIALIEQLGFARSGGASGGSAPGAAWRASAADIPLVRRRDRTKLELHWRLSRNKHLPPWPIECMKQHVVDGPAPGGFPLPVLDPAAQLFYLTCHGARHLWFRLKWLADIDRMVRAMPRAQLQHAAHLAQSCGCTRLFHTSLDLSRLCFATPVEGVIEPAHSNRTLLRDMVAALDDAVAVRERYSARDLRAAVSKARGRWLLRPDAAYRRELVQHTLIDAEDIVPGRPAWRAALSKLGRKLGPARR